MENLYDGIYEGDVACPKILAMPVHASLNIAPLLLLSNEVLYEQKISRGYVPRKFVFTKHHIVNWL